MGLEATRGSTVANVSSLLWYCWVWASLVVTAKFIVVSVLVQLWCQVWADLGGNQEFVVKTSCSAEVEWASGWMKGRGIYSWGVWQLLMCQVVRHTWATPEEIMLRGILREPELQAQAVSGVHIWWLAHLELHIWNRVSLSFGQQGIPAGSVPPCRFVMLWKDYEVLDYYIDMACLVAAKWGLVEAELICLPGVINYSWLLLLFCFQLS